MADGNFIYKYIDKLYIAMIVDDLRSASES